MMQLSQLVCRRGERNLFTPISLQLDAGECVELTGVNGAGKTTLLRTLAGIHQQYAGHFSVVNAFVYQGHRLGLDGLLSVAENLTWYAHLVGQQVNTKALQEVLAKVDMLAYARLPVNRLSQGQQRRVAMAKWLLCDAALWLLDEPLTSLDKNGQELLTAMLQAHCGNGGAAFYATHVSLPLAERRIIELQPAAG